jgi:hypothetical protein
MWGQKFVLRDIAAAESWVDVRLPQAKTGRVYPEIMDFSLKWGIELFNH